MQVLERTSVEAYIFALLGLAAGAVPMTWYLRLILILAMFYIALDLIRRSPKTYLWPTWAKAMCIAAIASALGAVGWKPIMEDYRGVQPPDLGLFFGYSEAPALIITNPTDRIARDVLYAFGIWNLDLKDRADPLPIRTDRAEYIRARGAVGPIGIFTAPDVKTLLKKGDHLFGFVSVTCPDCLKTRFYWVSITWGQGGWFSYVNAPGINLKELAQDMGRIRTSGNVQAAIDYYSRDIPLNERASILPDPWKGS